MELIEAMSYLISGVKLAKDRGSFTEEEEKTLDIALEVIINSIDVETDEEFIDDIEKETGSNV